MDDVEPPHHTRLTERGRRRQSDASLGHGAADLAGEGRHFRSRPRRRPAAKDETVQPCKKQVQGQRGRGLFPQRSPRAGILASREADSDPIFLRVVGAGWALMVLCN